MWLPTDVSVDEAGRVTLASPINVTPRAGHEELYAALEGVLQSALPLLEEVLTETRRDDHRLMTASVPHAESPGYPLWEEIEDFVARRGLEQQFMEDEDEVAELYEEEKQVVSEPKVVPFQPPTEPPPTAVVSLRGRRLQVIPKIAYIHLSPEDPEYPGGTWHIEGEPQEAIVRGAAAAAALRSAQVTRAAAAGAAAAAARCRWPRPSTTTTWTTSRSRRSPSAAPWTRKRWTTNRTTSGASN